jgi:hypothetical protein
MKPTPIRFAEQPTDEGVFRVAEEDRERLEAIRRGEA